MLWVSRGKHMFCSPKAGLGISPGSDGEEAGLFVIHFGDKYSPYSASLDPALFPGATFVEGQGKWYQAPLAH